MIDTTKMTREELFATLERYQAENLAAIAEAHPEIDMDLAAVRYMGAEVTVYPKGGLVRYICHGGSVMGALTDLGARLEADRGLPRQLYDDGYQVWIIEEWFPAGERVWVESYSRRSGTRIKGLKHVREVKRSSKGRYVSLGRRVYLTLPEPKGVAE